MQGAGSLLIAWGAGGGLYISMMSKCGYRSGTGMPVI